MSFGLIIPGLNIFGLCNINNSNSIQFWIYHHRLLFLIFLNSSNTSEALTGLRLEEKFALGIANGNFKNFKIVFITLCFGNLIATVFRFDVAKDVILDFFFFLNTKVNGPGQNFS